MSGKTFAYFTVSDYFNQTLFSISSMRKDTYHKLVEHYGEKCHICGRTGIPLFIDYLIPIASGGTSELFNLRLICHEHNAKISEKKIKEFDFVNYLFELLSKNVNFKDTKSEIQLSESKYRGDLLTSREIKGGWEKVLIEVKSFPTYTESGLKNVIQQLKNYKQYAKGYKLAFAFPGLLPEEDNKLIQNEGVEVWDINFIASIFAKEVATTPHPFLQSLYTNVKYVAGHDKLITELKAIRVGKIDNDWLKYQKHIERILEYLFSTALSSPITELSDHFKINRRDFILRNYAETGFWANIRNRYFADFIVIDAKNYSKKVTKKEVLQISNYLKVHGAGLFGIIFSRNGGDLGCYYTCREIWAMDKKMVIILDDNDVIKMIIAMASGNNPEEIIRQKIEQFRLSM